MYNRKNNGKLTNFLFFGFLLSVSLHSILPGDKKNPETQRVQNFLVGYNSAINSISAKEYQDALGDAAVTGYFIDQLKSVDIDLTNVSELEKSVARIVRDGKRSLLDLVNIGSGAGFFDKNAEIFKQSNEQYKRNILGVPAKNLDCVLAPNVSLVASVLQTEKFAKDANLAQVGRKLVNVPQIDGKIDTQLKDIISFSGIENYIKSSLFNNDFKVPNNKSQEISKETSEEIIKRIVGLYKDINQLYSSLKVDFSYYRSIPFKLSDFYEFSKEDLTLKVQDEKNKGALEQINFDNLRDSINLRTAVDTLTSAMKEQSFLGDEGSWPTIKMNIVDIINRYGYGLKPEQKVILLQSAQSFIISKGLINTSEYERGSAKYIEAVNSIKENNTANIKEKLTFILGALFSSKRLKITVEGMFQKSDKLELSDYGKQLNVFLTESPYAQFLNIMNRFQAVSKEMGDLNLSKLDKFIFKNANIVSQFLLNTIPTLSIDDKGKARKDLDFYFKDTYANLFMNAKKEIITSVFEKAFLASTAFIIRGVLPFEVIKTENNLENGQKKNTLFYSNLFNLQTKQAYDGIISGTNISSCFGLAGSGKSSMFKSLAIGTSMIPVFGKSFLKITTNMDEVPVFILKKNEGEKTLDDGLSDGIGMSNFQSNAAELESSYFLVRNYLKNRSVYLVGDEILSAGNSDTVKGLTKQPTFKALIEGVTGSAFIEHNAKTLKALSNESDFNIVGVEVIKDGKVLLNRKDLKPLVIKISKEEEKALLAVTEDPTFYLMLDPKTKDLVPVSKDYFDQYQHKHATNSFFTITFDRTKLIYDSPDFKEKAENMIDLSIYPKFFEAKATKASAESSLIGWFQVQPKFEKSDDGQITKVRFELVTPEEKIKYFFTNSASLRTNEWFQIPAASLANSKGRNDSLFFYEDPVLTSFLNALVNEETILVGKNFMQALQNYHKRKATLV